MIKENEQSERSASMCLPYPAGGRCLSGQRTVADPWLYQGCKRFRPYRTTLLVSGTCTQLMGKERGDQKDAKRDEVKALASVRRRPMSPSLCGASRVGPE